MYKLRTISLLVRFWHLCTGELIYTMSGHSKKVSAVSVTSMGDKTISGSHDCTIKVWNTDVNSRYLYCDNLIVVFIIF